MMLRKDGKTLRGRLPGKVRRGTMLFGGLYISW